MTPTPTPSAYLSIFDTANPLVPVLINVLIALGVLLVALAAARLAKGWITRVFARGKVNLGHATLMGNLMQVGVMLLGVSLILPLFGVGWAGVVTVLGAAGLAISLAMQDLLKNVVAGIYILMEQPFRIGDSISVKDVTGRVQGIELRTTILTTEEGLQVIVPNSVVLNEVVTNRSASQLQRQVILVQAKGNLSDMNTQINEVLKGFDEIAVSPAPIIALVKIEEGVAHLRVEFWAHAGVRITLTPRVVEALQVRFPGANVAVV